MAVLVYSKRYDLGLPVLERFHSFSGSRPSRAFAETQSRLRRTGIHPKLVVPPHPIADRLLRTVHTPEYVASLHRSSVWAKILEGDPLRWVPFPLIDWLVTRPMRLATAGSILAAKEAMKAGLAINFGGGYHHAKPAHGEGFCAISDIGLIVRTLRDERWLSPDDMVLYIDTDAHQGNGPCYVFADDPRVMLFDIYNADEYPCVEDPIYPYPPGGDAEARKRLDFDVPVAKLTSDDGYLGALRGALPAFLAKAETRGTIRLAIYNAGTDVIEGDKVGNLGLTAAGVLERDLYVLNELRARGIPTVHLPSGGYTTQSASLIAATAAAACERW